MKVVLLCGGRGTRLQEETGSRPKPMVEIGGKPILWHIMKVYSSYGFNEFVLCLGYKGYMIKEYFANYFLYTTDVTIHIAENKVDVHHNSAEPWHVTLVDTGIETMTGGRLKRIQPYIGDKQFLMTYGDGVGNIDICALLDFHREHGKRVTLTATQPVGRFGSLRFGPDQVVTSFQEKPTGDNRWINGGFFVLEPDVFSHLEDDTTIFEKEPLETLASKNHLAAYMHHGFWHPMDTLRDKLYLDSLWNNGDAPWKTWE